VSTNHLTVEALDARVTNLEHTVDGHNGNQGLSADMTDTKEWQASIEGQFKGAMLFAKVCAGVAAFVVSVCTIIMLTRSFH
jgi:hypothetical protein